VNPPTATLTYGGVEERTVYYTLQIWNNDGFGCDLTDFDLSTALPREFSWTYKEKSVRIAPGTSQLVYLQFYLEHDGFV
jgi:hypothetical protein